MQWRCGALKVKRIKNFLKGWGMNLKGHTRKYRRILQEELLELERMKKDQILTREALGRKPFIQKEMMRLQEEGLYWHKRSNFRWLLEGDNNSEFFQKNGQWEEEKEYYL